MVRVRHGELKVGVSDPGVKYPGHSVAGTESLSHAVALRRPSGGLPGNKADWEAREVEKVTGTTTK